MFGEKAFYAVKLSFLYFISEWWFMKRKTVINNHRGIVK